jgi:hypothetical protein
VGLTEADRAQIELASGYPGRRFLGLARREVHHIRAAPTPYVEVRLTCPRTSRELVVVLSEEDAVALGRAIDAQVAVANPRYRARGFAADTAHQFDAVPELERWTDEGGSHAQAEPHSA